jgi:hypothetical protein
LNKRDIRRATRRQNSAEEKIRIVLDGLLFSSFVTLTILPVFLALVLEINRDSAWGAPWLEICFGHEN